MKQLKDGGLGFFRPAWIILFPLFVMAVMFFLFWGTTKDWSQQIMVFCFFLFVFLVIISQAKKPVCVLYPNRLRVGKKFYYWSELAACYFQKRMVGHGKGRTTRTTLVFETHQKEELVIEYWAFLSKQDQRKLLAEVALHGVPQLPEKEPDHWILKTFNSFKRGIK